MYLHLFATPFACLCTLLCDIYVCVCNCNCNYTIPPESLKVCFNIFKAAGTVEQAEKRGRGASDGDPTDAARTATT